MNRLALLLLLALPASGLAQEAAPQLPEDPRAARFGEVERGAFVGFEVGYVGILKTNTVDVSKYPRAGASGGYASGFATGVNVGFDFGKRLSVAAFAWGTEARANANYGSFDLVAVGLDLRGAFLAIKDTNGFERVFVYAEARGGYIPQSRPEQLFTSSDWLLGGGLGVEYYTHLRHFSIGVAGDVLYFKNAGTAGFSVSPTLRYTF